MIFGISTDAHVITPFWFSTMKFSKNHLVSAQKSFQSRFFILSRSFPILYKLLSGSVENITESFMNKLKKKGPSMEP